MSTLYFKQVNSPVGHLKLVGNDKELIAILWENDKLSRVKLGEMTEQPKHPLLVEVEKQLNQYFKQERTYFDVPMQAQGTPFQEAVWEMLNKIPYGTTCTYRDIAQKINRPTATRAVGAAIGRNPISIIIPCHRVIGVNGSLTGFAGGLNRKQTLLQLELYCSLGQNSETRVSPSC